MPLYEYQGQQYDIATDDPVQAKAKIQAYLGKPTEPTQTKQPSIKDTPFSPTGEALSVANVVLGAPAFIAGALGTGYVAGGQILGKGVGALVSGDSSGLETDWNKVKSDVKTVSDPLSKLTTPVNWIVENFGLEDEFNNSLTNKVLGTVTEAIEWAGDTVEKKTGIPGSKAGTVALLDIGMLGVGIPGVKGLKAGAKMVMPKAKTSSTTPVVVAETGKAPSASPVVYARPDYTFNPDQYIKDTIDVPKTVAESKAFDDSLYQLNNLPKADITETINLHEKLKQEGIDLELQQKFQRYDEGQAKGNELINKEVYEINKKLNEVYSENQTYFKEGDYRSAMNPEGSIAWKDFPYKEEVSKNYELIEKLKAEKAAIESRRGTTEVLSPKELELYQKYFEPVKTEIQRLTEYAEKEGLIAPFGKDTAFASRKSMFIPKPKERLSTILDDQGKPLSRGQVVKAKVLNKLSDIKDNVKDVGNIYKEAIVGRDYTQAQRTEGNVAPAGEQRTYFVLEDAKGKREVVTIVPTKTGTMITPIREGVLQKEKAITLPPEVSTLTGEKVLGKTIREATVPELELNTGTTYAKDYSLVMGERLADLKELVRNNEWAKELITNPEYSNIVFKPKTPFEKIPDGFRQLQFTDKTPKLRDYYFENRYAEMLDDFNKPVTQNAVTKINNTLVTNMMLVPIAHMHNELFHWGITRGVSGFLNPKRLFEMTKDFPAAAKEVMQRGDLYKELLREGGSIMSANVRNTSYIEKSFNESLGVLAKSKGFKEIAKAVARSPADLYAGISKASNKSMWTVRDILYTQLVMEKKRAGMSTKEAIDSIERHMPDYRLPSRLITDKPIGRQISKFLGNRSLFLFARYHTGMLASAKNTLKDLAMLDPNVKKSKQFKEGLDSAIAISVAMSVLYPLLDDVAEMVAESVADFTGDTGKIAKAKVRRPGIAHVFDTMFEVAGNEKDAYSLASILVTPSPVFQLGVETVTNKELYNSRPITNLANDPEVIADQYASYLLRKIPQAGQAMQATNEDYGAGLAGLTLRNFFDIKAQTQDQLDRIEDQVERRQTEAEDLEYNGLFVTR